MLRSPALGRNGCFWCSSLLPHPMMLSHWLKAAWGELGLNVNTKVDPASARTEDRALATLLTTDFLIEVDQSS